MAVVITLLSVLVLLGTLALIAQVIGAYSLYLLVQAPPVIEEEEEYELETEEEVYGAH